MTFGLYPQTIKARDVNIISSNPDANGYYIGSDGDNYVLHKDINKCGAPQLALAALFISVSSYFFEREKGLGITTEKKDKGYSRWAKDKEIKEELTVKNYGVKVFSNSISWMFDFTYVFNKTNNIPEFIPKSYCSKTALKQPAKKTNPYGIYGIERVVFIALYHLEMVTGYRKNRIDSLLMPNMNTSGIVKMLMSQEQKFEQLNLEEKKLRLKKQKNKKIKQSGEINIINKKEKDAEKTIKILDKRFESDSMKGELKRNMKNESLKSSMIAKVGSKSNLKSSLKK